MSTTSPKGRSNPIEYARARFWVHILEIAPSVFDELRLPPAEIQVDKWARRWNLNNEWCKEFARLSCSELHRESLRVGNRQTKEVVMGLINPSFVHLFETDPLAFEKDKVLRNVHFALEKALKNDAFRKMFDDSVIASERSNDFINQLDFEAFKILANLFPKNKMQNWRELDRNLEWLVKNRIMRPTMSSRDIAKHHLSQLSLHEYTALIDEQVAKLDKIGQKVNENEAIEIIERQREDLVKKSIKKVAGLIGLI